MTDSLENQQEPNRRFGGFWRRFAAGIIDSIIVETPLFVFDAAAFGVAPYSDYETTLQWVVGISLAVVVYWLYSALFESSKKQATVGQQLLGLKVTDYEFERISFARASARHFASYLSILTLGIGFLMIAFTERKQALHDKIAKTLVVKVKTD